MNNDTRKILIALVFPLVIFSGWVAQRYYAVRHGVEIQLEITGYDPRDLLSGHYLQFQLALGATVCNANEVNDVCVCFDSGRKPEVTWHGSCDERSEEYCKRWLRGECMYQRFTSPLNRFYIPEDYAPFLARVPEYSSILATLTGGGNATVTDLLINDRPMSEYVEKLRKEQAVATAH